MAEITLNIESAPIALTLSAVQGPAGANGINGADGVDGLNGADGADGATTWAELTDKTTAPIATENTSVSTALAAKAPLSGASLENAEFYGSTTFYSDSFDYNPSTSADAHREALGLSSSGTAYFNNLTASGTVSANQLAITGDATAKAASRTALGLGAGDAATFASVDTSAVSSTGALSIFADTGAGNAINIGGSGGRSCYIAAGGMYGSYNFKYVKLPAGSVFGVCAAGDASAAPSVAFSRLSNGVWACGSNGTTGNTGGSISLTNLTASGTVTAKQYVEGFVDLGTVSGYTTIVITGGTHVRATLSPATPCQFVLPDPAEGLSFILAVRQATVSTTTATFSSFVGGVVWPGGVAPVLTPSPDRVDIFSFVAGRNLAGTGWLWHGSAIQDFTLT